MRGVLNKNIFYGQLFSFARYSVMKMVHPIISLSILSIIISNNKMIIGLGTKSRVYVIT